MRLLLLALLLGAPVTMPRASAAERAESADTTATLEDRLKTGLRVKAPRDVQFVETVAQRVREGRLPARLVDSTYTWAIARGKKHPFPAFEHVIRLQARKLNVPL